MARKRGARDFGFHRVDGNGNVCRRRKPAHDRDDARDFVLRGNRRMAGPGRLTAHVQNICAFRNEPQAVRDGVGVAEKDVSGDFLDHAKTCSARRAFAFRSLR